MKFNFKNIFNWERWSYDVIYLPIDIFWLWYAIKARHFWYFTPVNPTLIFAGFEGGSKKEMYEQLPKWSYPTSIFIEPSESIEQVKNKMNEAGLIFPVVVKPDSGMAGVLFRIIKDEAHLKIYHEAVGELYVLQKCIDTGLEYSVFYIRFPGEKKGFITGLIVKDYLHVIGNGRHSLSELVNEHPVAKFKVQQLKKMHASKWNEIIPTGTNYLLNPAGNHNTGAKFVNLNHEIDQQLCDVFDKISDEAGQYYFGRYDLKCTSLGDLKSGKNIDILEFNGAGAAITHVFDRNMSYFSALKEIVRHWRYLYKIGKINNKKGVAYWGFWKGYQFMQKAKKNFKRMSAIDKRIP
ncbi:MAG: hypothetical protein JST23_06045 [Bacteroidetes bacterium]|nr:hypothetical protein [Bacteroidota bacterium]